MHPQESAVPRTILAVDVEKFGDHSRTDSQRVAIHDGLYDALESALDETGVRLTDCHCEDRGDGVLVLAPPDIPKIHFSDRLPYALDDALRRHNRAHSEEERIRLRVTLNAGEVYFLKHGVVSDAVNKSFRLLNSAPLREALKRSPDTLAVMVSSWFYDVVIRNARDFRPGRFSPSLVDVKETVTVGWSTTPSQRDPGALRQPSETWRIRVRDADGKVHGPGILICGRFVITSAEVAAQALQLPSQNPWVQPSGRVAFDVPARPNVGIREAEVIWWRPDQPGGTDPIGLGFAGLSVAGPAIRDIAEAPLHLDASLDARLVRLRTCSDRGDGRDQRRTWALLQEHHLAGHDRVPLVPLAETSPPLTDDYRGSEVIDERTGDVLGIAIIRPSSRHSSHGWMIPLGRIADEWPLLGRILPQSKRLGQAEPRSMGLNRANLLRLVDASMAIPALADAQSRHTLATRLPPDVVLTAPRSCVNRADLAALLWSCSHVPEALLELARMIRETSRGGRQEADLANDLERLEEQLLPRSLRSVTICGRRVSLDHSGDHQDPAWAARQAIAEALRRVDLLRDPEGHRMCVEIFQQEIGEAILRPRMDQAAQVSDDAALLDLVDQLLSRDVAMWVFTYTISDIYGSCEITESVRAAVHSHLAEPLLTREQRRELHQLCDRLTGLNVPQLFTMSVDRIGFTLRSDPANLRAVLNELEELPARNRDGLYPIAAFVEYLASEQQPEARDPLRAWTEAFVGSRTPHVTALHSIRNNPRVEPEPGPRYCIVQLDPDEIDPSRFFVSVHLQEGGDAPQPLVPIEDFSYTEDEVKSLIGKALNDHQLMGVNPADLRIEFLLPMQLINLPVDQWKVSATQVTLGVQYQVVVRSLTRLRDLGSSHSYWHEKWSTVPEATLPHPDSSEWLVEEAVAVDHDRVFVMLVRDGGPAYLLASAPASDRCEALILALAAGIPILLWSRRARADLRLGLNGLLADGDDVPLSDLPRRILEFRSDGAVQGVEEARHLTLLYDDADRIPGLGNLQQTLA